MPAERGTMKATWKTPAIRSGTRSLRESKGKISRGGVMAMVVVGRNATADPSARALPIYSPAGSFRSLALFSTVTWRLVRNSRRGAMARAIGSAPPPAENPTRMRSAFPGSAPWACRRDGGNQAAPQRVLAASSDRRESACFMKDLFTRHERLTRASADRIGQLRMNYNKPLELLLNPGNGPYRAGADSSRYQGND